HSSNKYHRPDKRTYGDRLRNRDSNWAPLMPALVQAYLRWKYPFTQQTGNNPMASEEQERYRFRIRVADIYTLEKTVSILPPPGCQSGAEALILHGYLGATPLHPSLAFSLRTMDLFRRVRLYKPSFSVEAFAKLICDFYEIPYRRTYRVALADAFDVYLDILRAVNKQVRHALGQDTPNWRVLNACPPCTYKLQGEPELAISRMYVLDGNDSLKRLKTMDGREVADKRVFEESDYFLPNDFVNKFAHEVKSRRLDDDGEGEDATQDDSCDNLEEGDPTDGGSGDPALSPCVKNWKAAAADEKKKMWGIFAESGIFASACRHGFILWLVDMVMSGELAKYPLAIIAKILELFPPKCCGAYDIGCRFLQTILNSSLGPAFKSLENIFCVNAFHGYSHGYDCQRRYHPSVIPGMGLEDLETLERVFSASNQLAPIIRHASAYRRRLLIDQFFIQWDADKYANLAQMLYDNYVQALEIVNTGSIAVKEAMRSMCLTEQDLDTFEKEEIEYVNSLGKESDADIFATTYVELLEEMRSIRTTTTTFVNTTPQDYQAGVFKKSEAFTASLSAGKKIESARRTLIARLDRVTQEVNEMELAWDISRRWDPGDTEYIEALKYSTSREYHRALDHLHKLVVQRIMELHKMNIAQTGYRMRTHIAKSLRTRCTAIQNAVKRYNVAAQKLDPPRPPLDWERVTNFAFISEFTLLKDTRNNIQEKRWSEAAVRNLMREWQRVQNAEDEIKRCNVEVRRLHTAIIDEGSHMRRVLAELTPSDPIYGAVAEHCRRRREVNAHLLARISDIHNLRGFSGEKKPGVREGHVGSVVPHEGDVVDVVEDDDEFVETSDLGSQDDSTQESLSTIVDWTSQLAL
ncbi:hypothetical protein K474DRAFT_1608419, partial [Panus rudis PR-1116 ss-1]